MSLIHRIAISRQDRGRQTAASEAIAAMDRYKVAGWNKSLRAEITRKVRAYALPIPSANGGQKGGHSREHSDEKLGL